jgi:hypothetical protein
MSCSRSRFQDRPYRSFPWRAASYDGSVPEGESFHLGDLARRFSPAASFLRRYGPGPAASAGGRLDDDTQHRTAPLRQRCRAGNGADQGSDRVELKLTVPESDHRSAVEALQMDPLDAQIRQVFFFDTPDLALNKQGVVVRACVQKKGDDSVVKLEPVVPSELPKRVRRSPEFGVEVDAMPGGFVCSGSMKGAPNAAVREVVAASSGSVTCSRRTNGRSTPSTLRRVSPVDDLTLLGPIFVLKLRLAPKDFGRKMVPENVYPENSRIPKLSTKCEPPRRSRLQPSRGRSWVGGASTSAAGDKDQEGARVPRESG